MTIPANKCALLNSITTQPNPNVNLVLINTGFIVQTVTPNVVIHAPRECYLLTARLAPQIVPVALTSLMAHAFPVHSIAGAAVRPHSVLNVRIQPTFCTTIYATPLAQL